MKARVGTFTWIVVCAVGCEFSHGVTPTSSPVDARPPDTLEIDAIAPSGCEVVELAAGGDHTCARRADGLVYCWGRASAGEVGITPLQTRCSVGTTSYLCEPSPRKVEVTGALALGLGASHSCASTTSGTYCWGANQYGTYGDGTVASSATPHLVANIVAPESLQGGVSHACSLRQGSVSCSGRNLSGEVGDGTAAVHPLSSPVFSGAASLAASEYTSCAIDTQGALQCWGRNAHRQIDQSGTAKLSPTLVSYVSTPLAVAVGRDHLCTVHADGTAKCWGSNVYGQLGNGMTGARSGVVTVGATDLVQLSTGPFHTCARDGAGSIRCFGNGYTPVPTAIALPRPAIDVASGTSHDCAITDDHHVWCWGNDDYGQLGNATTSSMRQLSPVEVSLCP